jgi:hypothetical protein
MKKTMIVAVLTALTALSARCATESLYNARIWAIAGPVRLNTNAFEMWSTNPPTEVLLTGGLSNTLGYRITATNVSQPSSTPTNDGIWFPIHIAAKSAGNRFLPRNLKCVIRSSDTNNYLGTTTDLTGANITYTRRLIGIRWNGAPRQADTILDSQVHGNVANEAVDEVIFIGAQAPYFNYANQADRNAINAFVNGFPNWQLTCTWMLSDGGSNVLARAVKTLETTRIPLLPIHNITANASNSTLGVTLEGVNSAILYSRPTVTAAWQMVSTVNDGDIIVRPAGSQGFFQAFLQ